MYSCCQPVLKPSMPQIKAHLEVYWLVTNKIARMTTNNTLKTQNYLKMNNQWRKLNSRCVANSHICQEFSSFSFPVSKSVTDFTLRNRICRTTKIRQLSLLDHYIVDPRANDLIECSQISRSNSVDVVTYHMLVIISPFTVAFDATYNVDLTTTVVDLNAT